MVGCHKAAGTGVLCVARSRTNRQEPAMSERSSRTTDTAAPLAHGDRPDPATEAFLAYRNLLFTVAYEMLGSAADAGDVLQGAWDRWAGVDLGTVRDQRGYQIGRAGGG